MLYSNPYGSLWYYSIRMSATKIINVLKDDSFDEILDLFRNAQAEEVIFVLPKRSKVFSKEDHFLAFASEARSNNKKVSLMSSNPATNQAGVKYGFNILSQPVKKPRAA